MSSKIFRGQQADSAITINWRRTPSLEVRAGQDCFDSARTNRPDPDAVAQAAYQAGLNEGQAIAAQRLEPAIAGFNAIVQELAGLRRHLRCDAEQDLVKLAIAIAQRVLHRELATDPEAILGLVKAAFERLNARETQRLRLGPTDARVLDEHRDRLSLPPRIELVVDGSLPQGSVIFETTRGNLDASIGTQLAEIERGFTDLVRRQS
jgi:flagellar assembly protein FliH